MKSFGQIRSFHIFSPKGQSRHGFFERNLVQTESGGGGGGGAVDSSQFLRQLESSVLGAAGTSNLNNNPNNSSGSREWGHESRYRPSFSFGNRLLESSGAVGSGHQDDQGVSADDEDDAMFKVRY